MKYCFPLSFCPFVRLVNVGKADRPFAIFLFFIYYMPRLLPLFQTFISAVFYSFMSHSLMSFDKEERGIGIKSDNKASQHRLFFFKSLIFIA